jgi:putative endonuclease
MNLMRRSMPKAIKSTIATANDSGAGCFVYVLGSSETPYRTYVGWTIDLDRRLAKHNAGTGARSTRGRNWTLIYVERHPTRHEAMKREWQLKRDRRLRKLLAQPK